MAGFNLHKLLEDVFKPIKEDKITVMVDVPHGDLKDNEGWRKRREMANEWREGFKTLAVKYGFTLNPLVQYRATGSHNAGLPSDAKMNEEEVVFEDIVKKSTLIVAMTEFSPSAPMIEYIKKYPELRVASMPLCNVDMQQTALAADYKKVAGVVNKLKVLLEGAIGGEVLFSTGHKCYFDLRFRKPKGDPGMLPPDAEGRLINLPSGEAYIAPYEGEGEEVSQTQGELPVQYENELVVYKVDKNRIIGIVGNGVKAKEMQKYFDEDSTRRNIAEFGLGCNDKAVMRGLIIEDEKAGFHWAYGRSDHIGGVVGVDKFKSPKYVVHLDLIYAKGSPVVVDSIELISKDKTRKKIWDGEWYTI